MGRDIRGERICGARVEVCFGSWDEREGLGLDSFMGSSDQNSPCQCRRLDAYLQLFLKKVDLSQITMMQIIMIGQCQKN